MRKYIAETVNITKAERKKLSSADNADKGVHLAILFLLEDEPG